MKLPATAGAPGECAFVFRRQSTLASRACTSTWHRSNVVYIDLMANFWDQRLVYPGSQDLKCGERCPFPRNHHSLTQRRRVFVLWFSTNKCIGSANCLMNCLRAVSSIFPQSNKSPDLPEFSSLPTCKPSIQRYSRQFLVEVPPELCITPA